MLIAAVAEQTVGFADRQSRARVTPCDSRGVDNGGNVDGLWTIYEAYMILGDDRGGSGEQPMHDELRRVPELALDPAGAKREPPSQFRHGAVSFLQSPFDYAKP